MSGELTETVFGDERLSIHRGLGRSFSGSLRYPVTMFGDRDQCWGRFVCRANRGLSDFPELYEDTGSLELDEEDFNRTFEVELLDPVIGELYERQLIRKVFEYFLPSNPSVTEEGIFRVIDFSEQRPQFSPDFVEIKKWISFVTGGLALTAQKEEFAEKTEELVQYLTPEARREIEKEGLEKELCNAVMIARATLRNLHAIEITVAYDPEIPGRKTFRMVFTVSGSPVDVLADEGKFKKQLYSILDARARGKITVTYRWEK